jgi:hypothetical protein
VYVWIQPWLQNEEPPVISTEVVVCLYIKRRTTVGLVFLLLYIVVLDFIFLLL